MEACSQLEKSDGEHQASPPASVVKRCTRASRLHSPEQPCTPVGSTHEADISDVESWCSAVSDKEAPMTRTRGRRKQPPTVSQEHEEISDVESCSSAVSASNAGQCTRRSTRRKTTHVEVGDVKANTVQEAESCSSAVSESQRVSRSQRKSARSRVSAKQQTEDSELSDTDSYLSSVSGADVPRSTRRRATRSGRQIGSIPIHLDEAAESSLSPASTRRSSRSARGKAAAATDVSEPQSCDSEGFESGPTYSMQNRKNRKAKALDSDSELTDVHSLIGGSCSTRSRGTPSSSRTSSWNSSQGTPASRHSTKRLSVVVEKVLEPVEKDSSLNDSRLESTVIADDAECTLLEEENSQTLEDKERDIVNSADPRSNEADTIKETQGVSEDSHVPHSPGCEEAVSKPAVTVRHQQEEPCVENKERDTSEIEVIQETVSSSEPLKPCKSVMVALHERTCETTEQTEEGDKAMEVASRGGEAVDATGEIQPGDEEQMEVKPLSNDGQWVLDSSEVPAESIQVTLSRQHHINVDSGPEQQPEDVTVQNRKAVSLLESSEDEDEEEEREVSEDEHMEEQTVGPSNKSEAAGISVDGLFMIDTRPGQEVDEHYYMEKQEKIAREERDELEEQEEFVDEEGDDDDEDANILFSSRNPLL